MLLSLNSLFSALTCVPIFLIARKIFSEKVAVGSAWAWALLPNVMFWCTRVGVGDESCRALLATVFWLALTWKIATGGYAVVPVRSALGNYRTEQHFPAVVSSCRGLVGVVSTREARQDSIAGVVLASVIFLACITPWIVRNDQTFGRFIFIRDNFGAELRMGNGHGADGTWMEYLHPTQNVLRDAAIPAMGELAYVAMRRQQASTTSKRTTLDSQACA